MPLRDAQFASYWNSDAALFAVTTAPVNRVIAGHDFVTTRTRVDFIAEFASTRSYVNA